MQYVLTRTQKLALVLLALLVLLAGWYVGIYTPIQDRIRAADTAGLEDEIALEQMKASKIKAMQAEIDENRASGAPVVPSYNNFKQELKQLNEVYGRAYEFSFTFSEPEVDGTGVRRKHCSVLRGRKLRCGSRADASDPAGTVPQHDP